MAFLTSADIVNSAMRIIGAIGKSEVPSSDEMMDGLQALNLMLELWSARRLMVRGTIQFSNVLTAGKYSYTIGTGGNFNTLKPVDITSAFLRDANNIDTGLDIISREEYDSYGDKMITSSRPIALCYDAGAAQQAPQMGTVLFYYIPDGSTTYTVFMQLQVQLTDFSNLTSQVTFEAKYGEAMKYELAIRLWREYHESDKPIPEDIKVLAARAMCVIEKTNHELPRAQIEVPPRKSVFNIYTGDYQ
jgi:hypothetical protein